METKTLVSAPTAEVARFVCDGIESGDQFLGHYHSNDDIDWDLYISPPNKIKAVRDGDWGWGVLDGERNWRKPEFARAFAEAENRVKDRFSKERR